MRIPLVAPTPVPTMTAVGVARPREQGQAIDKTVRAQRKANWKVNSAWLYASLSISETGSRSTLTNPTMIQATSVMTDTVQTMGTKYPATLSASCWIGALLVWASSTSRTIWAKVASWPTCVATMKSRPCWLTDPPITSESLPFRTGIDSPVIKDSSHVEEPLKTFFSTKNFRLSFKFKF